jgi:putative hydrolase of the HAD superfamily
MLRSGAYSLKMKKPAITYWLIPAKAAHSFFQDLINDLALRYDAPVFEPHMTIHVGLNRFDVAEKIAAKASACCGRIEVKTLEVSHSSEFTKTLFVRFASDAKLSRLNDIIRNAAQDSSDYQLKPHLSFLYKKLPAVARRGLADSIKLPFSHVVFDSIKVVRCVSPTRSRADVEAWHVVAAKALGG